MFLTAFSCPEPTILLACGRNRELWEQPFQACAIDADYMRPDGQNSVISFVISKWLFPELSIPAAGQKDRRLWGREWFNSKMVCLCHCACALRWGTEYHVPQPYVDISFTIYKRTITLPISSIWLKIKSNLIFSHVFSHSFRQPIKTRG